MYFKEGLFIFAFFIGSSHCDRLQRFYAAYDVAVAAKDSSVPARCWVKHEQLFFLVGVGIVAGVVFVLKISKTKCSSDGLRGQASGAPAFWENTFSQDSCTLCTGPAPGTGTYSERWKNSNKTSTVTRMI